MTSRLIALDSDLAQPRNRLRRFFVGLVPVDGALHLRIEVLNPDARPRHAGFGHCRDSLEIEPARIDLDGKLDRMGNVEVIVDAESQSPDVVGAEDGRRSAAPMNMGRTRTARHDLGYMRDLIAERRQVGCDRIVAPGDLGVTAAEPAQRVAIGDVQIERQGRRGVHGLEPPGIVHLADALMEMRRRRIAGVARHRSSILPHQRGYGRLALNRHRGSFPRISIWSTRSAEGEPLALT